MSQVPQGRSCLLPFPWGSGKEPIEAMDRVVFFLYPGVLLLSSFGLRKSLGQLPRQRRSCFVIVVRFVGVGVPLFFILRLINSGNAILEQGLALETPEIRVLTWYLMTSNMPFIVSKVCRRISSVHASTVSRPSTTPPPGGFRLKPWSSTGRRGGHYSPRGWRPATAKGKSR